MLSFWTQIKITIGMLAASVTEMRPSDSILAIIDDLLATLSLDVALYSRIWVEIQTMRFQGFAKTAKILDIHSNQFMMMAIYVHVKSNAKTKLFWPIFTISESFPMRSCMSLYLKRYQIRVESATFTE